MDTGFKNDNGMVKIVIILAVGLLGAVMLFLSISRAGLERTKKENNEGKLRNREISVKVMNSSFQYEDHYYKIPETGMLPGSPFYGLKILRDNIWIQLTRDPTEKAKLVLLLADKKIAETEALFNSNQTVMAIEAGSEALDKLKYADKLIGTSLNKDVATQLNAQIILAGLAYQEIVGLGKELFEVDQEKYGQLVNAIESWNASQKEEKEQSEY